MKRKNYYYNKETCRYEKMSSNSQQKFFSVFKYLSLILFSNFVFFFAYSYFFKDRLYYSNDQVKTYISTIEEELEKLQNVVFQLEQKDDDIYRSIFQVEKMPTEVRTAGVGGSKKDTYEIESIHDDQLKNMMYQTANRIEKLKRRIYIQSRSYKELDVHLDKWMNKAHFIPSIQPIENKNLLRLASTFGPRLHPVYNIRKMHYGCDFSAPQNTPIYATADGVVKLMKYKGGYGKTIEIVHGNEYVTRYAHLHKFNVTKNQKVKRGQIIGFVGSTGVSLAPHVHYEVMKKGKHVNPVQYFFNDLTPQEYKKVLEMSKMENQPLDG